MAEYHDREHYIPMRRQDLIEMLCTDTTLPRDQSEPFRQFCRLVAALYHFEYHDKLEELKAHYAPFDPDTVTASLQPITAERRPEQIQELFDRFTWLMERANFKRLSKEQIAAATEEASDWGINLDIDFSLFEHLEMFVRGDTTGKRLKRHWLFFWKVQQVEVPVYQRVVVVLKLTPRHRRLRLVPVDTDDVFLKLFKEIPKDDIEMLLPGGQLKMPRIAKGKLGLSLVGAVGFVIYKLIAESAKLAAAIAAGISSAALIALFGPLSLIAGYGYKQWAGYQTAKQAYSLQLTQSLYYQNLDSNAGVLYHLLDEAEEQECREAILGYFYLWRHAGEQGWTAAALDDYIEAELERRVNLKVDFEIGDALTKLETLNLVEKVGDRYRAVPLEKALERLDYRWDNYFQYNRAGSEPTMVAAAE